MSASVQILNSDLNSVPNPAGTEANLTISGVTSTPALHADTVLVQAQVLGGQVYYNYFNNPDSDSFYVWEGTILRMSVGDWNAIRFLEKTGSPVIHYTEKMYNRTASRVSADLIAALDYVNFDWLYNAVVRKTQRDPSTWDPTAGQQEAHQQLHRNDPQTQRADRRHRGTPLKKKTQSTAASHRMRSWN